MPFSKRVISAGFVLSALIFWRFIVIGLQRVCEHYTVTSFLYENVLKLQPVGVKSSNERVNSWQRWVAVNRPTTRLSEASSRLPPVWSALFQNNKNLSCPERETNRIREAAVCSCLTSVFSRIKQRKSYTALTFNVIWISFLVWPGFINPGL